MIEVANARSDADIAAVTALAWEFAGFLRDRYPERIDQLEQYLKEQRFEEMLANFRSHFNPPEGECMLARMDGAPVGIVMLKPAGERVCEMNRMFVSPAARGQGVARKLCEALIAEACALGYVEMRLGALDRHVEALPLYRSLGFENDPNADAELARSRGAIYMRMRLEAGDNPPA